MSGTNSNSSVVGEWKTWRLADGSVTNTMNLDGVVPVSMALMPDGKIVGWASDAPNFFSGDTGTAPSTTWEVVFDPLSGAVQRTDGGGVLEDEPADFSGAIQTQVKADMFCPGIAYLFNGDILVNGGDSSLHTSLFTSSTGLWGTWTDTSNMNIPRGYNSSVTLSTGKVFTVGGSWAGGLLDPAGTPHDGELYDPATGLWSLTNVSADIAATFFINGQPGDLNDQDLGFRFFSDDHNWLFAMPNGLVFDAGPKPTMMMIDPNASSEASAQWSVGLRGDDSYSINGAVVMYDAGKILKVGGALGYTADATSKNPAVVNLQASAAAYLIDVTADYSDPHAQASVTKLAPMNFARAFANAVVLPDGEVFIVGGQSKPLIFSDSNAVMTPEIWSPTTQKFTTLAPMPIPRDYHSVALLLGDGSVIVGGGGLCAGCAANFAEAGLVIPASFVSADHSDFNIFQPSYLFNADGSLATRPTIQGAPSQLVLGHDLVVKASADTTSFSLVRFAAATHDIDTDQRRISLTIVSRAADGTVDLAVPADPGITVPGYWMLFAMNANGTPSIAATVQVLPPGSATTPDPVTQPPVVVPPPVVQPPVTAGYPVGGPGNDTIGGGGSGTIVGGGGTNVLIAQGGPNTVLSTGVNDFVVAADGLTTVNASGSGLNLLGGTGSLVASVSGAKAVLAAGDTDANFVVSGDGSLVFGGSHLLNLHMIGGAATIAGGTGQAFITADQDAVVFGGPGALNFLGNGAATVVSGVNCTEQVGLNAGGLFSANANSLATVTGGAGQVTIFGGAGSVTDFRGSGLLVASSGNETLNAAGSTGSNFMVGSLGTTDQQMLLGGSGADTILAAAGAATISGGAGADAFVFFKAATAGQHDIIRDFDGNDSLYVLGYDPTKNASALVNTARVDASGVTVTLSDNTQITFSNLNSVIPLFGHILYGG